MDRAIIWNARGVGNSPTMRSLKDLIRTYNPCFIAILELILREDRRVAIGLKLRFHSSLSNYEEGGKVWVFHHHSLNITVVNSSDQMLLLSLSLQVLNELTYISIVYASCNRIQRRTLWREISNLASSIRRLWVIGGDFNAVLNANEKLGAQMADTNSSADFFEVVQDSSLQDAGFSGNRFTWCNNREGAVRVWARLDRVLFNICWGAIFSSFQVQHLPTNKSDHAPLLVSFPSNF
ncbi:uncharacterized protein LOC131227200 [Magnolia sinica]|uniref:uncharacterized protein LOC131227200 n=1 Tax=Magnolia sinica TaxID=86752 RepID=UPI00265AC86C|nr:uncharacterized protein LOC131227200 [Magnolia sinica]